MLRPAASYGGNYIYAAQGEARHSSKAVLLLAAAEERQAPTTGRSQQDAHTAAAQWLRVIARPRSAAAVS